MFYENPIQAAADMISVGVDGSEDESSIPEPEEEESEGETYLSKDWALHTWYDPLPPVRCVSLPTTLPLYVCACLCRYVYVTKLQRIL